MRSTPLYKLTQILNRPGGVLAGGEQQQLAIVAARSVEYQAALAR